MVLLGIMFTENNVERKKWNEHFDKFKKQANLKKPGTLKEYIDSFSREFRSEL